MPGVDSHIQPEIRSRKVQYDRWLLVVSIIHFLYVLAINLLKSEKVLSEKNANNFNILNVQGFFCNQLVFEIRDWDYVHGYKTPFLNKSSNKIYNKTGYKIMLLLIVYKYLKLKSKGWIMDY